MACKTNLKALRAIAAAGTLDSTQLNRMAAKTKLEKGFDAVYEVYVNNILSGPITHGVNIGSNLILTLWTPTQTFLEGASALARTDFAKANQDFVKTQKQLGGLVGGIADIFKLYNKHNNGDPTKLGYDPSIKISADKLKQKHAPAITSEKDNLLGALINRTGAFVRFPGNALVTEDLWFKMIHYRMKVNSDAVGNAMSAAGDRGNFKDWYNFYKSNPSTETVTTAKDLGEYFTFTNRLGENGAAGTKFIRSVPGARYLFPFLNTPTNIVKMGLRNGMFGNLTKDLKVALAPGSSAVKRDEAMAKIAMGTFAPLAIMSMMDEDRITGRIDKSTPSGRFRASQGRPPYSIRAGDTWYSYERIEPFRSIMGLYTTMRDAYTNLEPFDPETGEPNPILDQITFAGIAPIIQTVGDNYMLNEIGGVLEILTSVSVGNPDTIVDTMTRVGASMTVPAALRQVNRSKFDEKFRIAEGFVQKMAQGIPGMSSSLPARRTLWGDEQYYPQGLGPDLASPVYTYSAKQDEVDRKMIDLDVDIPGVPKFITFPGGQGQAPIKVKLTPKQREDFSVLRGKGASRAAPTLKASITRLFNDRRFIANSEIDRRIFTKNLINKYSNNAIKVLRSYPEIQQKYAENLQLREAQRARTQGQ